MTTRPIQRGDIVNYQGRQYVVFCVEVKYRQRYVTLQDADGELIPASFDERLVELVGSQLEMQEQP